MSWCRRNAETCWSTRDLRWYRIGRLNLRPGSFLGHLLWLYHSDFTVSIPSNRSILF